MAERYHARAEQQRRADRERLRLRLHPARPRRVLHAAGAARAHDRRRSARSAASRSKASCARAAASRAARWHSALEIMSSACAHAARSAARATAARPARRAAPRSCRRAPAYRRELGLWAVPMPTIDPEVVRALGRARCPSTAPTSATATTSRSSTRARSPAVVAGVGTVFALAQLAADAGRCCRSSRTRAKGPTRRRAAKSYFRVIFQGRAADQRGRAARCAAATPATARPPRCSPSRRCAWRSTARSCRTRRRGHDGGGDRATR